MEGEVLGEQALDFSWGSARPGKWAVDSEVENYVAVTIWQVLGRAETSLNPRIKGQMKIGSGKSKQSGCETGGCSSKRLWEEMTMTEAHRSRIKANMMDGFSMSDLRKETWYLKTHIATRDLSRYDEIERKTHVMFCFRTHFLRFFTS